MEKFGAGIVIEGGQGKAICFSAILSALKKKHGDLVLVNPYPDVFVNNPNVARNLVPGHSYLFEDYLKDIPVFKREPYHENSYRLEKKHLIEVYCEVFGVPYSEDMKPEIFIKDSELEEAKRWKTNELKKDFILVQFTGGTPFYSPQMAQAKNNKTRDYPIELAQKFIDLFTKKYPDIAVVPIRLQTEPVFNNTINLPALGPRQLYPLIATCKAFVGIDSFVQHASAAFNKKGVVLWNSTDPKKLGYKHNINLVAPTSSCKEHPCHRPEHFYDQTQGNVWECPYNQECRNHSPELILEKLSEIIDQQK